MPACPCGLAVYHSYAGSALFLLIFISVTQIVTDSKYLLAYSAQSKNLFPFTVQFSFLFLFLSLHFIYFTMFFS